MKKSFGQNLLVEQIFLEKIIEATKLDIDDLILEIGAGSGLLTSRLAEKAKKVHAVEIERNILKKLKASLTGFNNVEIIEKDILKVDLNSIFKTPFKVIGNIPYNITSKILVKLFGDYDLPAYHLPLMKEVFLMLQLEVAERIVAKPGTRKYGSLSLLVQYFSEPEILFNVPKESFFPIPKVNSAFVYFKVKKEVQYIKNPIGFKSLIKKAFNQRRKKVINSLVNLGINKEELLEVFKRFNYNSNLRAENLTFQDYLNISNALGKPELT